MISISTYRNWFFTATAVLLIEAAVGGVLLPGGEHEAAALFVAPEKSGQADGTYAHPFNTLVDARDAIRVLRSKGHENDIVVYLFGGRHVLDRPVEFDERDSGGESFWTIYAALPGETPVISGSMEIKGWQEGDNGIWHAPAEFNFRQLYVDDQPAIRARTPNQTYYTLKGWDLKNRTLLADADAVSGLGDVFNAEFRMQHVWADTNLRIASVTVQQDTAVIEPREPERTLLFDRSHPRKKPGLAFHFENALAFLDQPGEFFLDTQKKRVFYKPLSGQAMESVSVRAPRLTNLLSLKGTLDNPVKNLKFTGLTFEGTNWLKASESGLLTLQAGMYNIKATPQNIQHARRQPAAVYAAAAHHLLFERNIFRNTGAAALDLHFGTSHCRVRGNVFRNIAGNGIQHAVFSEPECEIHVPYNPEDPREICSFDSIENNYFTHIGTHYFGSVAIASGYPTGLRIEHNEITNTPYTGISIGWGWCNVPNAMRQNKIRYNHIHQAMQMLGDGGAIYLLSPQPDSEIAYNYIHDITPSQNVVHGRVKGIYLDEGTDGYTVHHNVVMDAPYKLFRHRVGPNNHFHNNYILLDEGLPEYATMLHEEIKKAAGLEPEFRHIKDK